MYPFLYQLQENEYVVVIGKYVYVDTGVCFYINGNCIGEYPLVPEYDVIQSYHTFFDELSAKKFIKEWWAKQTF